MEHLKAIISGGGTGGHIYPALAIGNALERQYPDAKLLFVGAIGKMEMEKIPRAGYNIIGLWISGFDRKQPYRNILFPLKLIVSLFQAFFLVLKFRPNIAIGTGGFASGPVLFVASLFGIPTLIQEQNSYPGITNKLLAKRAKAICVAYNGLSRFFPNEKIVLTGNPVRQDILELDGKTKDASAYFNTDSTKTTVLVLGGSLGAKRINQLIESKLSFFKANNIQLIWQCGALYFDKYKKYSSHNDVQVSDYIKHMDLAYAVADIVISRSGASSVSELCIVGKPVIFIPSPNVAEDHQTKNARSLSDKKAAILISESDLEKEFETKFLELIQSKILIKTLKTNIKKLARPTATAAIVDKIKTLLKT